jgi:glycogen operon protein
MADEDWSNGSAKAIAFLLSGEPGHYHLTEHGEREPDDSFLVMLNASEQTAEFVLPQGHSLHAGSVVIDTARENVGVEAEGDAELDDRYAMEPRSFVLIRYRGERE